MEYDKLSERRLEPSECIREQVEVGRERLRSEGATHFESALHLDGITCNADMGPAEVRQFFPLDDTRALMRTAMSVQAKLAMQLSARAYHGVLKLARTIAGLAGALRYRPRLNSV